MVLHHPSGEAIALVRQLLAARPVQSGEGITGRVAQTGEAALLPAISPEEHRARVDPAYWPFLERFAIHSLVIVPLRTRQRIVGVLGAWRDITQRPYTTEDQLLVQEIADRAALAIENARLYRQAAEHAAALERAMQARDELLALVSHDLKNPLTSIKGTAQVVERQLQRGSALDPARLAAAMVAIEGAAAKAAAQIDGLLDIARIQAGEPLPLARRSTDLVALVRATAAEYQQTTESHRIVVETTEPELVGEWDGPRLERAIGNLLSNAIKYSPEGGAITVRVARERDRGDWAVVAVSDRGIGIPAAELPRLFDRYYRGTSVVGRIPGTGLGLSGVRSIVEAHGGSVTAESVAGEGSTFTVRLPLTDAGRRTDPADAGRAGQGS
jgi:signal transduction histidine kinase